MGRCFRGTLIFAAGLFLFCGCGDDEETAFGACQDLLAGFDACGGDLEGSWETIDGCRAAPLEVYFADECPQATASGTFLQKVPLTFESNSLTMGAVTTVVDLKYNYPLSCLMALGAASCEEVASKLVEYDEWAEASCQAESETCACTFTGEAEETGVTTLDFTTADGVINLNYPNSSTSQWKYCVKGSSLAILDVDSGNVTLLKKK